MPSNNPVFARRQEFSRGGYATFGPSGRTAPPAPAPSASDLDALYASPSATTLDTGRMSYDDVVVRTGGIFVVLLVAAVVGWQAPGLGIVGAIGGLVLGLVNSFKREPSRVLILAYGALQGLFMGGISAIFDARWPGIVPQAVLATLAVFAVSLVAYRSGKVRVTPKSTRIFLIAMGGYLLFSLVNLLLMVFTNVGGEFGLRSGPLGFLIGLFAVGLAAYSLVMDFDFVERGVRSGLPERYAWTAAFGITVTLVWLYVEMLRLLAILRGDD